jgi:TolB-like protein
LRAGIFLLGLAGLALVASSPPALAGSVRVALLPIVVHSAESDTSYLKKGLGDMLASRIERTPGLSVVQASGEGARTTRRDAAVEAGSALDAEFVVYGSFTQFGTGASLDIRCTAVALSEEDDSNPRQIFVQTGSAADIIPKLDDLAGKIGRYVLAGGAAEGAPASAAGADGSAATSATIDSSELEDLRERVERLENALYDPAETIGDSGNPLGIGIDGAEEPETVAGDGGT